MVLTASDLDRIYQECLLPCSEDRITGTSIYDYCVSPFMVYCGEFGPQEKKDALTQYQKLLLDQGLSHEAQAIEAIYPEAEKLEYETPEEGFRLLLEGMSQGVMVLCGLPAFYLPQGLVGVFDVIQRKDTHPSVFGDYHYVVTEIKLARRIEDRHLRQATFYNYLLGKIQGYAPPTCYVLNRDYQESKVAYDEAEILTIVEDIREILAGKEVSPTHGACAWPWETYNNEEAIRRRDVSLISGVGQSLKEKLSEMGICTVDDLAELPEEDLQAIKGVGAKTAKKFSSGARALVSGECIRVGECQFPENRTEIFLDLEGTGEQATAEGLIAIDYLIGALIRRDDKVEYTPFVAHGPDEEWKMFRRFVDWLLEQGEVTIYHWHSYERTHLKRLAERYALPEDTLEAILGNMRDLHKDAVSSFAFPTYSSGLKDIARHIGYEWKHPDVDAMESIALYFQYTEDPSGNRDNIQKIMDYNEDDCRATMLVKDWLEETTGA
jgi:predicted RecB family nuclease